MTGLDDIDREILQLLAEDARRSYREIAERVDRSPPTVSDRIDRLQETGVIERFTLDVDRSMLADGSTLLVELDVRPGSDEDVARTLADASAVEHVVRTVDGGVLCVAHADETEIGDLLADVIDGDGDGGGDRGDVRDYSVRLVAESTWKPKVGGISVAIECVVCGKSVEGDGVSVELGERTYEVCCSSCVAEIEAQYDELERAAESD